VKYAWIHEHRGIFDISAMCRCLGANRAGYYRWAKHDHHDESDLVIVAEIVDVMNEVCWSFGVKRNGWNVAGGPNLELDGWSGPAGAAGAIQGAGGRPFKKWSA
jgi:hypothetical protein